MKNCQYDRLRDHEGKAPGLLGWWPEKACTFVDNHDTGSTQQVRCPPFLFSESHGVQAWDAPACLVGWAEWRLPAVLEPRIVGLCAAP